MKPALTIQEPTVTGWLRAELYGDKDKARGYLHQARSVLGGLRSRSGVNERIAEGEPGGFYHQWATLPDGTQIHAMTNDGHDTLRIYAQSSKSESKEEKKEEKEEPTASTYLWVGVRIKWADSAFYDFGAGSGVPYYGCMVSLAEPLGEGEVPNGLLWTTINAGWDTTSKMDSADPEYVLTNGSNVPTTLDELITAHHNTWNPFAAAGFPKGWHCLTALDPSFEQMFYTKNGLLGFDWQLCSSATALSSTLAPFDPLLPEDGQMGNRDFGSALADLQSLGVPVRAWDTVFVLDPAPAVEQVDDREHILNAQAILERAGMASEADRVLSGEYLLNIGAWGEQQIVSSREGQEVPTLDPMLWLRASHADFSEYRTSSQLTPMTVEVEVRLGREEAGQEVFNFELVMPRYDSANRNTYPFGEKINGVQVCAVDAGVNTMANWYPQAIAIDVNAGTAELSDNRPEGVFSPSGFSFDDYSDRRYPIEVYVYGDYGASQVSNSNYPQFTANAIAQMLDEMTTGFWGANNEIQERLNAAILGAAGGLVKGSIWKYDIVRNEFTALPVISAASDYDYVNTSRLERFFWFYPYRAEAKRRCSKVFAILLGAAGTIEVVTGQQTYSDDPADLTDIPACCPENFFGS